MSASSENNQHQRSRLRRIAERAMIEKGLLPAFSAEASAEASNIQGPATVDDDASDGNKSAIRELTGLLWASIDNDDSRDLDQLTVAEPLAGGAARILVAIANVDVAVKDGSAIDEHARHNTTSVYTAAGCFPCCRKHSPPTSRRLNPDEDRLAIVVEMVFGADGSLAEFGHLPGACSQSGKARLQRCRRMAGWERRLFHPRLPKSAGSKTTCERRIESRSR